MNGVTALRCRKCGEGQGGCDCRGGGDYRALLEEVPPPPDEPDDDIDGPEAGADAHGDFEEVFAEIKAMDGDAKLKRAREVANAVLREGLDVSEVQQWRDVLKAVAGLSGRDFDAIAAEAKREAKQRAKRKVQDARAVKLTGGPELPSPDAPIMVARALLKGMAATDGVPHRAWWRGDFYTWQGTRWDVCELSSVEHWLYGQTADAYYFGPGPDGRPQRQEWKPNRNKINNLSHALGVGVIQRFGDPSQEIACTNGVLDLATRVLRPHAPARFNLHSLPFDYDRTATCPTWDAFLVEVLPEDKEGRLFLQEWFGYVISGRTDLQKIASLIGPTRCGKGTIARVLQAMLGPASVVNPTLEKMGTQFGEQSLIGKRLATLSDVRWNSRAAVDAVPVLLAISGEDSRTVPRKNREDWHGQLDVRFMVMSNDTPTFTDASGALATRMIHLHFRLSFAGREDPTLTQRLLTELSGILNWSLVGLARLNKRGSIMVPASSSEVDAEVRRLASPVTAFVDDRATLSQSESADLTSLFRAWKNWCWETGRESYVGNADMLSKNLMSAYRDKITKKRERVGGKQTSVFYGIAISHMGSAPEGWS